MMTESGVSKALATNRRSIESENKILGNKKKRQQCVVDKRIDLDY